MNIYKFIYYIVEKYMCYFPLAEARKKRKMFSHTLLGAWWNQGVIGWCRLVEHIFVVVAQRSLTVSHPPSPFIFISRESRGTERFWTGYMHLLRLTPQQLPAVCEKWHIFLRNTQWHIFHIFTSEDIDHMTFSIYTIFCLGLYNKHYTVAWRYDFYLLVLKTIFYSLAALVHKILFSPLEYKSHIFMVPCNILYYIYGFSKLKY